MRFRLRSLLVVFLLLCLSAPWWNQWRRDISNWMRPPKPQPPAPANPFGPWELGEKVLRENEDVIVGDWSNEEWRKRWARERVQN